MCASALQTSFKTYFLWGNAYKHLSLHPFIVWAWIAWLFLQQLITSKSFWATPVCWMWESLQQLCAQYTSLKIVHLRWKYWQFGIVDRPGTSLSQQYAMQSAYRTHCCWYPRYWIFRHTIFKQLPFLHLLSNGLKSHTVITIMLKKCCVKVYRFFINSFEIMFY